MSARTRDRWRAAALILFLIVALFADAAIILHQLGRTGR